MNIFEKIPINNSKKNSLFRRSSSCFEHRDNIFDKLRETHKHLTIISNINIKDKIISNDNNKFKANYKTFSLSPKLKKKTTKLPLLLYDKYLKNKRDERIKNFQKMRNYRIKLKKNKKS